MGSAGVGIVVKAVCTMGKIAVMDIDVQGATKVCAHVHGRGGVGVGRAWGGGWGCGAGEEAAGPGGGGGSGRGWDWFRVCSGGNLKR